VTLPHWALHLPQIYGQLLLAVLILINSIFSWLQKRRMEAREEKRQSEIASNLELSQKLVEEHAALLKREIEDVKRELRANTQVNVEALEKANGFNEKIAAVAELAAALPVVQQVEIVQAPYHPVLVKNVEEVEAVQRIGGSEG